MQCVLKVIKYVVFVACPFGLCGSGLLLGLPSVGFSGRASAAETDVQAAWRRRRRLFFTRLSACRKGSHCRM